MKTLCPNYFPPYCFMDNICYIEKQQVPVLLVLPPMRDNAKHVGLANQRPIDQTAGARPDGPSEAALLPVNLTAN